MNLDEPSPSHTPSVGTPIRLAPSTSAFRQSTVGGLPAAKRNAPQSHAAAGVGQMPVNASIGTPAQQQPLPNKGLVGHAVDLIFGW
jgi:hypothetical protein